MTFSGVFIVNFKHISYIVLVSLLLLPAGNTTVMSDINSFQASISLS